MAAERAASRGLRTLLLEKNPRPGVKILMSGGTRCNLTHNTDAAESSPPMDRRGGFLHSALAALGPRELVGLVEAEGVATKIEDTGKIFPVSNRATDVLAAFMARLERTPCELSLSEAVTSVKRHESSFEVTTTRRTLTCDSLILTVGGQSYPGSGTSGDGYAWARDLGHTIVPPRPALVPIVTAARVGHAIARHHCARRCGAGAGSAEQPRRPVAEKRRTLGSARGSLLFTHFGLSGPVAAGRQPLHQRRGSSGDLDARMRFHSQPPTRRTRRSRSVASAAENGKRQLASLLPEELPRRLSEAIVELIGADE